MRVERQMYSVKKWLGVAVVALLMGVLLTYRTQAVRTERHDQASAPQPAPEPSAGEPRHVHSADATVGSSQRDATTEFTFTELPPPGTRAKRKVLVRAKYGPGETDLGKDVPPGEGEVFPPQGFTPTADGKLLVLDSAKKRLVWYDSNGKFERALPLEGLEAPADVAVASDGTIIVVDHEGVQTKGMQFLDPSGKKKAELPQVKGALATGMYAVGKDVYLTKEGLTTIKAGDTSGSASDETPGIYNNEDDGVVPGHIAPDGRTVVSAGIDNEQSGQFFVSSISGETPVHNFSRHFKTSGRDPLLGMPFTQSDAKGDIYTVLYDERDGLTLICIDGKTGDPVGAVSLPSPVGRTYGTPFRKFSVVPSGGLIYQELADDGSTYEWFDCH
jgi:hypothetical protein